jgi:hypothetical protein
MPGPSAPAVRKRAATFTPMAQALASPATAQGAQAAAYGGPAGQTDSRRAFAQALAGEAISGGPVAGPLGAIAQALKGAIAGGIEKKADQADQLRTQNFMTAAQAAGDDPRALMAAALGYDPRMGMTFALDMARDRVNHGQALEMQGLGFQHAEGMQGRGFQHDETMQGRGFQHAEGMQQQGFGHAERMQDRGFGQQSALQGQQFGHQEKMAGVEHGYRLTEAAAKAALDANAPGDVYKMRDDFLALPAVKNFGIASTSYEAMLNSEPGAAGDLTVIANFVRMNDPNSVVMPGEALTVQNSGGLDAQVRQQLNNWIGQGQMPPDKRAALISQAGKVYKVHEGAYRNAEKQFQEGATRARVNPADVTMGGPRAVPTASLEAVDPGADVIGGAPTAQAGMAPPPVATQPRAAAPPAAAIQHLKANPGLAAAFDEKYGPGVAARVLGQ